LTDRKKLRSFGLLVGAILLAWGAWRLYRQRTHGVPMVAIGGALAMLGLVVPQVLRLPYRAWMALGHLLGVLNTRLLLLLAYFLLIVPIGLVRRLIAGSSLAARERRLPDGTRTYFKERQPDPRGGQHFENMF
jgi:hypothetical protein